MDYFTDLFNLETWDRFREHGADVSGFSRRHRRAVERISKGDTLCCYLSGLSRWCGLLEVTSDSFEDAAPIFADPDPYPVRLKVRPLVQLDPELSIPIFDEAIWPRLSTTRDMRVGAPDWPLAAGMRNTLRQLTREDGDLLFNALTEQNRRRQIYPYSARDLSVLRPHSQAAARATGNARRRAIERMTTTVWDTVANANGQQVLRTVKNKELRFSRRDLEKHIADLIEGQEGLCAITHLKLQFDDEHNDSELLCSLDRIDSDGHYEPGNLQVVCRFVNRWKNDGNDGEFRRLVQLMQSAGKT